MYNPYTCYQVQAGTATWTSAFNSCSGKGVGFTTMIMRTNAEYTSAEYFRDFVFQGSFWVCLFRILKLKVKIKVFIIKLNGRQLSYGTFTYTPNGGQATPLQSMRLSFNNELLVKNPGTTTRIYGLVDNVCLTGQKCWQQSKILYQTYFLNFILHYYLTIKAVQLVVHPVRKLLKLVEIVQAAIRVVVVLIIEMMYRKNVLDIVVLEVEEYALKLLLVIVELVTVLEIIMGGRMDPTLTLVLSQVLMHVIMEVAVVMIGLIVRIRHITVIRYGNKECQ